MAHDSRLTTVGHNPFMTLTRPGGRAADQSRPFSLELDPLKFADGSAMVHCGDTQVLVAATVDQGVPRFLDPNKSGWLTAEYSMLPGSTSRRSPREAARGRIKGRTAEIQRLIGRSLRAAFDLSAMPGWTLTVDCDVLQADGGTRTASITGAWAAAVSALSKGLLAGDLARWPGVRQVAAISVGVVDGAVLLDLEAIEDQAADVDLNIVGTSDGEFVEVQGTGERTTFSRSQLDKLLDLAEAGLAPLFAEQKRVLNDALAAVEEISAGGARKAAEPKDEGSLWDPPG